MPSAPDHRSPTAGDATLDLDPDALRRKYREERDRRLRADGNEQYVEVKGEFAHFLDDPYAEPGFSREPLEDEVELLIVRGGFGSLRPGWHQHRMDNFNALVSGVPQPEDLVHDGWTDLIGKLLVGFQQGRSKDLSPEGIAKAIELADFEKMNEIRARVDATVKDPATAEALKPYYRQFCKRPCFHNEYLETFNRPNVTLVDTHGRGVDRITKKGVVVDGREYELDCLIYASGFEVGTDYSRRAGMEIHGRDGESLCEAWAKGIHTLHGMHVHGFPNCFIMSNAQAGFTASYPHLLDQQARHLAYIIHEGLERGLRKLEATREAEEAWVARCISKARNTGDFFESCTPGYYNNEGKTSERSVQDGFYGGGPIEFFQILESWRKENHLAGLELV